MVLDVGRIGRTAGSTPASEVASVGRIGRTAGSTPVNVSVGDGAEDDIVLIL